jgi:16S rRNA (cytosine967-C5)-methyltransferase
MENLRFMTESKPRAGSLISAKRALDLRVNTLLANRDEVIAVLSNRGFPQSYPVFPVGVRVGQAGNQPDELFLNGKVEVQMREANFSLSACPQTGDMVVDFCAGAGGKADLGVNDALQGRVCAFLIRSESG